MRVRWGLFARLAAVVAILLLLMQLLLVWLYVSNRGPGAEPGFRFPLPERVVAMVELVEAGGDEGALLAALNGPDLLVTISDLAVGDAAIPETRLPRVERALARYAAALGPRPYAAYIAVPEGTLDAGLRARDRSLFSDYPLRMAIGLADGRTLIVETRDDLVTRVYSVPVGLWSGVLGVAAALVVLVVLRRETAPLRALARAAERFTDGQVQPLDERGAPEIGELIGAFNRMQLRIGDLLEARRGWTASGPTSTGWRRCSKAASRSPTRSAMPWRPRCRPARRGPRSSSRWPTRGPGSTRATSIGCSGPSSGASARAPWTARGRGSGLPSRGTSRPGTAERSPFRPITPRGSSCGCAFRPHPPADRRGAGLIETITEPWT